MRRTLSRVALTVATSFLLTTLVTWGVDVPANVCGALVQQEAIRDITGAAIGTMSVYRDETRACAEARLEGEDVEFDALSLSLVRCLERREGRPCELDFGQNPAVFSIAFVPYSEGNEIDAPPGSCIFAMVEVVADGKVIAEAATPRLADGTPTPMC
jgi:hypothetical protein